MVHLHIGRHTAIVAVVIDRVAVYKVIHGNDVFLTALGAAARYAAA